jgi:hypothetical protein
MDRRPGSKFAPSACSMCCGDVRVARDLIGWRSVCQQCGDERAARLQPVSQSPITFQTSAEFTISLPSNSSRQPI